MKKIIFIFMALLSVISAHAQFSSDATVWSEEKVDAGFNHSGFFVNPAVGYYVVGKDYFTGRYFNERREGNFGFDLDLGYRWYLGSNISWDVIKVGCDTDFGEDWDLRVLTGIRYNSPVLFSNKGIYVAAAVGYSYLSNLGDNAIATELGFGLNLSRLISLGLMGQWNFHESSASYNTVFAGLQLGLNF